MKIKNVRDFVLSSSRLATSRVVAAGVMFGIGLLVTQKQLTFKEIFSGPRLKPKAIASRIQSVGLRDAIRHVYSPDSHILDVREDRFFQAGRIRGASHFPVSRAANIDPDDIGRLNSYGSVLLYGHSQGGDVQNVASVLSDLGLRNLLVYEGGCSEWASCRLPTDAPNEAALGGGLERGRGEN